MGNLKDVTMEGIADIGNGNYAYIDTLAEAQKVLVDEFDSTMFVVAQDLKLQVEFNPAVVAEYRLIGYNNRRLENEDFANDAKDAGDVGAGHAVTAFYELVLAAAASETSGTGDATGDPLKYQDSTNSGSSDYFTVAVRYKEPGAAESRLVETPVAATAFTREPSTDFRFASAVAEFGLVVTDSAYRGDASADGARERAADALGEDAYGLRKEFLNLVKAYKLLD
jgi:Ca-activated chloride channel family protein